MFFVFQKYDNLKELEKHPLRFNFHDGHIDAEVCSVEDDSQTALNVKRAVISLFQVAASQSFSSNVVTEVSLTPYNLDIIDCGVMMMCARF